MISAQLAVDTLIEVNHGTYTISKHWTINREFTQTYASPDSTYTPDKELDNKILMQYVPHEWINN